MVQTVIGLMWYFPESKVHAAFNESEKGKYSLFVYFYFIFFN